jgi:dephospho-CoA kinase
MRTIGVTGGIGSGKTVVCKIFNALGIPVFDSDIKAKEIINNSPAVRKQVEKLFGTGIYSEKGLDRTEVARLVFEKPDLLNALNSIVHPAVATSFTAWKLKQTGCPFVIKEAAILFESGTNKQTDAVISVVAPESLRLKRVMERDGRSETQIKSIMQRQMNDRERVRQSDYVIVNDDETPVLDQVLKVYDELRR